MQQGRHPIELIARETGFADRERMREGFLAAFGRPRSPYVATSARRGASVDGWSALISVFLKTGMGTCFAPSHALRILHFGARVLQNGATTAGRQWLSENAANMAFARGCTKV